jgi:hypothetical protein
MRRLLLASLTGVIVLGSAPPASAQASAVVHVRIADTAGAPIAGVVITILRVRQENPVSMATSDAAGRHTFSFAPDTGRYQLSVQKLGYVQTTRLVPVGPGDTVSFDLRLARAPTPLAPIRVTAQETVWRKEQFIDADAIAHSPRPLADAIDVVDKLRPDMVWGVAGPRPHCDPATNVWINGTLIRLPTIDNALVAPKAMATRSLPGASSARKIGPTAAAAIPVMPPKRSIEAMPLSTLSILESIKPEHIETMEYHDCGDMSMGAVNSNSAIFIVLKPGIGYSDVRGSYVDSTATPPPK